MVKFTLRYDAISYRETIEEKRTATNNVDFVVNAFKFKMCSTN